jgi:nucleoside-diphosphate-sugar epimerase
MPKRVLLTGHDGYIGSVLVPFLLEAGWEVTGLDTGYFHACTLVPDKAQVRTIWKDIRELAPDDLEGFDAVIHLAALSNDPIGNLNPDWTETINHKASIRLAEYAKVAGVGRFLFSSSCIMYGMSEAAVVDETSPLDPKTDYARSKVLSERAISQLAAPGFSPVFLRNGTVYGLSPRMRFDTVFNNLMGLAVTTGRVLVLSDGKPWRPVIHVQDLARSFVHVLDAPVEKIHNQAFNNGADHLNHQIIELAETVVRTVPGCRLEIQSSTGADKRTYQASFAKFARMFPEFRWQWDIAEGAVELYDAFRAVGLTEADFNDRKFTRLKWLRYLLDNGKLDGTLRWSKEDATAL